MKVSSIDRFIPQRKFTDTDVAYHNLGHKKVESVSDNFFDQNSDTELKPVFINTAKYANNIINYRKLLGSAMGVKDSRIINLHPTSKGITESQFVYPNKSAWPVTPRQKPLIGPPDILLDMPDIDTTLYNHVIDWGKQGQITTIFHGEVHLWTASTNQSFFTTTSKTITECVRWNREGTKFAASRVRSRVSVIDAKTLKIERTVYCNCLTCTITAIEWSQDEVIVTGCSSGSLICIRKNTFAVCHFYKLFKNEVIDLKFSCNDTYLLACTKRGPTAIFKWPISWECLAPAMIFSASDGNPFYIQSISWHPWKESILAVGEIDHSVTIWNVNNQKIVDYNKLSPYFISNPCFLDCLSFNPITAELLVSFYYESPKFDHNFLTVFSDLHTRVDEVSFHTGRVPHALWDGTGTKLATVGSDESLVIWNFFGENTNTENKLLKRSKKKRTNDLYEISKRFNCIR